jgi:hypothetical protein
MPLRRLTCLLALALISWAFPALAQTNSLSAGPLAHTFPLALEKGERFEALGPLYYQQQSVSNKLWAIPPLIARVTDPEVDMTEMDILYPLVTYDRFGKEYRFQIFQLFSFSGGQTLDEVDKDRFTLFPFYFQQRSKDTNLNYTALMPLYGTLKNRLFRDEIFFVAFPVYGQSRKKDVVTDNYLFPFFHLRHGNNLNGWQFWPLVGHEFKGLTTKTNVYQEVETIPGHEKTFVLWPFFFDGDLNLGTENPQKVRVLLPFYSLERAPLRDSSTYLWPLFTYTDDREKKYHEYGLPWPFIVFARGEKTINRFWPLFGQAKNEFKQSDFYLWPIWKYNRTKAEPLDRERTRIFFFLYSDLIERNTDTSKHFRRVDFWPFFTFRKELDGRNRLQVLAPLEPFLPGNKSIERSYSPLWSLWRDERNPRTQESSQSLLWNLYRHEKTPATTKNSLLFGLFQYEKAAEARSWRFFYVPFGKRANGPAPAVAEPAATTKP